jgi:hypothetical protein
MPRQKLPNRRPCETFTVWAGMHQFHVTVGYDPDTAEPMELFVTGRGKSGSAFDFLLADMGVLASLALQFGVSVADLLASMSRDEYSEPASAIGLVLQELVKESAG